MRTTIKRLEHLERSRPAAISRANPSDVRDRIPASLNDRDESNDGRIRTDFPLEEAGSHQLSLRERILKRLSAEDSLVSVQLDRYMAGELHGVLFPMEIISGWLAQDSKFVEALD
jgi:hypothetical protein